MVQRAVEHNNAYGLLLIPRKMNLPIPGYPNIRTVPVIDAWVNPGVRLYAISNLPAPVYP